MDFLGIHDRTFLQEMGAEPKEVFVDLGYRGVDKDNPGLVIHHRGKIKSMSKQQRRCLKRRQAVEPVIGHLKSDHRMDRCWLKGELGDALHAVLCAAGYNLRWLLRAILAGSLEPSFLYLLLMRTPGRIAWNTHSLTRMAGNRLDLGRLPRYRVCRGFIYFDTTFRYSLVYQLN